MSPASNATVTVNIEFGGGTELLTSTPTKKTHNIVLPARVSTFLPDIAPAATNNREPAAETEIDQETRPVDVRYLLQWLRHHLIVEREELFLEGDSVRPGILVLINNADWELEGELEYALQNEDELVFISTLHGG